MQAATSLKSIRVSLSLYVAKQIVYMQAVTDTRTEIDCHYGIYTVKNSVLQ